MTTAAAIAALLISTEVGAGLGSPTKLGERFPVGTPWSESPGGTAAGARNLYTVWGRDADVRGAVVDLDGRTTPFGGELFASPPGLLGEPRVAHVNGTFLVVWTRDRLVIEAVRVDEDGRRLDAAPFVIFRSLINLGHLTVTASNDQFLVGWRPEPLPTVLSGVRVLPSGLVLDLVPIPIAAATGASTVSAASDGADFLFVWNDGRSSLSSPTDLFAARVTASGTALDTAGFLLVDEPGLAAFPQLVWTGTQYLVAYATDQAIGRELRVRPLLAADGGLVGGPVAFNFGPGSNAIPVAIESRPPTTALLWFANSELWIRLLDTDGRPGAFPNARIAGVSYGAGGGMVATDAGYFIEFVDNFEGRPDLGSALATLDGGVGPKGRVTARINDESMPTIARSGLGTYAGWSDLVFAARVKRLEGPATFVGISRTRIRVAASDTKAIAVAEGPFSNIEQHPLPAGAPVVVGDGRDPAVAARGSRFLVAWEDRLTGQIEGAITGPSGRLGNRIPIGAGSGGAQRDVEVSASQDGYLAVWVDEREVVPAVYAIEVGPNGDVKGPPGGARLSPAPHLASAPAVARGHDGWLVAWERHRPESVVEVEAAWLASAADAGWVIRPLALPPTSNHRQRPGAGRVGDDVVLAWEEGDGGNWDVMAARIPPTPDAGWSIVAVASSTADEAGPAVSSSPDGLGFIAYTVGSAQLQDREVFSRSIELRPMGTPCSNGDACGSGVCVDGVCCDSACGGGAVDCMACSVASGGAADGICGPIQGRRECRPAASACDVAEECAADSTECPPDVAAPNGTACVVGVDLGGVCAAGACSPVTPSTCDGGGTCPPAPPPPGCGCTANEGTLGAVALLLALVRRLRAARARRGTTSSPTARPSASRGATAR